MSKYGALPGVASARKTRGKRFKKLDSNWKWRRPFTRARSQGAVRKAGSSPDCKRRERLENLPANH